MGKDDNNSINKGSIETNNRKNDIDKNAVRDENSKKGINKDIKKDIKNENTDKNINNYKRTDFSTKKSTSPSSKGKINIKSVGGNFFRKINFSLIIIIVVGIVIFSFMSEAKKNHDIDRHRLAGFSDTVISDKKIKINNKSFKLKNPYKMKKKVYYIPAVEYLEKFGLKSSYTLNRKGEIDFKVGERTFILHKGDNVVYVSFDKDRKITLNGNAEIINSTLYVPMEFLSKVLDVNVHRTSEGVTYLDNFPNKFDYTWAENNRYIAHALGGIGKDYYTNSYDALVHNYKRGLRVFEADISETSDNQFVLIHTWNKDTLADLGLPASWEKNHPTLEEFSKTQIKGLYKTMSYRDIVKYMSKHKDMYLVLDMKASTEGQTKHVYSKLVKDTKEIDPEVLDRLIPQIYSEEMYKPVMEAYKFKSMIYTMYRLQHFTEESITNYAYGHGIKVVASYRNRFTDSFTRKLKERGIKLYMYTYNSPDIVNRLFERGVYGVYTDFLPGNKDGYGPN